MRELNKHITDLALDRYREFLLKIARPSIELTASHAAITSGCSKFGGSPDLPAALKWPHHGLGPYRFIGQINLSEIPKPSDFPKSGLLSFFYAYDEKGKLDSCDPDFVRVFYLERTDELRSVMPPEPVRLGSTSRIACERGADVPPWPYEDLEKETWPIDKSDQDAYWELRLRIHPSRRYLLGFPFNTTLAYDPTPGPEWRSLMTLSSNADMEWCWHDGDWLVTFIEDQRLLKADFSRIKAVAG
jgi:uncharacterized protein YwqG